jgi:glycosyltransferase involved in cell wall biosynthesis
MRIALDAQLTIGSATGIGEYVRGLTAALQGRGAQVLPLKWNGCDPWRFDRRVLWDQVGLPLRASFARVDLLHCASGTMPAVCSVPIVVTVHDVAWLRVQAHARRYARMYFGTFSVAQYKRARRILVDSCFSRDELAELTDIDPACVDVVYPGVAEDMMRIERKPDPNPFILAVGTVERRKNLEVVIRALRGLPGASLTSVGPFTPYREECERIARECGVSDRVAFRGYIPRPELLDLYARASAAVVPSVYEGFGYGVAQAMCAGVPFIAANASSLPEAAAGNGVLLGPYDVDAWEKALAACLSDTTAADAQACAARMLAVKRFSWGAAACATIEAYRKALQAGGPG